jgi:hypothetical protein
MAPVLFLSHFTGAGDRCGRVIFLRVLLYLSGRFFLETVNSLRNEHGREVNSSDLSAKEELLSFENERVGVDLLLEVTRELDFGRSSGIDVLSHEVG